MQSRVIVALAWCAAVALATPVAAGQAGGPVDGYRAPRTPDGQPDISGIWRNDTLTPLERPARLGDQTFFTAEEVAALRDENLESLERDNAPGGQRTQAGGIAAGYNRFWSDARDSVVYTGRTSLVADPPTGRVPTTPEAEARARWLVEHRSDDHLNMSPYSRCITRGVPGSMIPNTYNTGNQILQVPGYVGTSTRSPGRSSCRCAGTWTTPSTSTPATRATVR